MFRVHDQSLLQGVNQYIHLFQRDGSEQRLGITGQNHCAACKPPIFKKQYNGCNYIARDCSVVGSLRFFESTTGNGRYSWIFSLIPSM